MKTLNCNICKKDYYDSNFNTDQKTAEDCLCNKELEYEWIRCLIEYYKFLKEQAILLNNDCIKIIEYIESLK